ncbi:hypothetical protein SAMN05216168_5329 [Kosakonia radicincitans]|uniref:hypothetical protein n=1 Tax=Kosakonia radicincitans TaxID=283686 RepID=UPI0009C2F9C2|nr:hypothetical protein [Kosakonia radicincitans]SKC23380.1 hypothetical protein SAMN05216168_5329 [Kosakonia radicincitans]
MPESRDIELNTGTCHKCEISGGEQADLVMTPRQKVDLAVELVDFIEKKAKESNYKLSGSDFSTILGLADALR